MNRVRFDEGVPRFITNAIEAAYRFGTVQRVSIQEILPPDVFSHGRYPVEFFDRFEAELRWKLSDGLAAKGLQVLFSTGLVWQTTPYPGSSGLSVDLFKPVVWNRAEDPKGSTVDGYVELTVRAVAIPAIVVPMSGEW